MNIKDMSLECVTHQKKFVKVCISSDFRNPALCEDCLIERANEICRFQSYIVDLSDIVEPISRGAFDSPITILEVRKRFLSQIKEQMQRKEDLNLSRVKTDLSNLKERKLFEIDEFFDEVIQSALSTLKQKNMPIFSFLNEKIDYLEKAINNIKEHHLSAKNCYQDNKILFSAFLDNYIRDFKSIKNDTVLKQQYVELEQFFNKFYREMAFPEFSLKKQEQNHMSASDKENVKTDFLFTFRPDNITSQINKKAKYFLQSLQDSFQQTPLFESKIDFNNFKCKRNVFEGQEMDSLSINKIEKLSINDTNALKNLLNFETRVSVQHFHINLSYKLEQSDLLRKVFDFLSRILSITDTVYIDIRNNKLEDEDLNCLCDFLLLKTRSVKNFKLLLSNNNFTQTSFTNLLTILKSFNGIESLLLDLRELSFDRQTYKSIESQLLSMKSLNEVTLNGYKNFSLSMAKKLRKELKKAGVGQIKIYL